MRTSPFMTSAAKIVRSLGVTMHALQSAPTEQLSKQDTQAVQVT